MTTHSQPIKRLNATLPPQLAEFVGEITGENGLYETPSEFVRDLIRRYMEKSLTEKQREINALLRQSLEENNYSEYTPDDIKNLRELLK